MNAATLEPLPIEVGQLGNFDSRMTRNFRMAVDDWDEVCSALGEWEAAHLTSERSSAAFAQHSAWVTQLMGWGRFLEDVTKHPGFTDRAASERVSSRLRHLQDKLDLWHRDMSREEEDRILRAAFA